MTPAFVAIFIFCCVALLYVPPRMLAREKACLPQRTGT